MNLDRIMCAICFYCVFLCTDDQDQAHLGALNVMYGSLTQRKSAHKSKNTPEYFLRDPNSFTQYAETVY